MPKFVKVCKNDFTTFHNAMWRDSTLDYPEKGLLGTMLTLPDNWNFSIKGLAALAPSGEHKIGTSLKKLEKAGYLKREAIRSNGRIIDWKYSFSDEPIFRTESNTETETEDSSNSNANNAADQKTISTPNVENYVETYVENSSKAPDCGNRNVAISETEESPHCGFQDVDTSDVKKRIAYQIPNNQILSNQNLSINQTLSKREQADVENFSDEIDEMDFEENTAKVEEQIMADRLCDEFETELVNEIVSIITSVYVTKQRYQKIAGDKLSIGVIRKRLKSLEYMHIVYVLNCLAENTTEIKNRRSYLLTCLFNAPMTIDGYYANQVAFNMARRE